MYGQQESYINSRQRYKEIISLVKYWPEKRYMTFFEMENVTYVNYNYNETLIL